MEDNKSILETTLNSFDENQLGMLLHQIGRRMLILRATTPDSAFWYSVLMRVNKWLSTTPILDDEEKTLLCTEPGPGVSQRIRAVRHLRDRTGMRLHACLDLVDDWISNNMNSVHESVKASYISYRENKKGHADEAV